MPADVLTRAMPIYKYISRVIYRRTFFFLVSFVVLTEWGGDYPLAKVWVAFFALSSLGSARSPQRLDESVDRCFFFSVFCFKRC